MSDSIKESQPAEETIILHSPGPIPGIPGDHGPGTYLVNWQDRTITPIQSPETASAETAIPPSQVATPTVEQMDAEIARLQQELDALEHPA